MSTDHQIYSIAVQHERLARYAVEHEMVVVQTYCDSGISGVTARRRKGLLNLIRDVHEAGRQFEAVLVYDVSRWGRFQDVDESAHYEYVCRRAGVQIIYCAESFHEEAPTPMDAVIKSVKRAMAAEFSREMGEKVHATHLKLARLGHRQGGGVPYGMQRLVVDPDGHPIKRLELGQRRERATDRVAIGRGKLKEVRIVKKVFALYVGQGKCLREIAEYLNSRHVRTQKDAAWDTSAVSRILRNEAYVGRTHYNKFTNRLGARRQENPAEDWIALPVATKPIIQDAVFERARVIRESRTFPRLSEEELLKRLKMTLDATGPLSAKKINASEHCPSAACYCARFGSVLNAYRLIGYVPPSKVEWRYGVASRNARARLLLNSVLDAVQARLRREGFACRLGISCATRMIVDQCLPVAVTFAREGGKKPWCLDAWRHTPLTLMAYTTSDGATMSCYYVFELKDRPVWQTFDTLAPALEFLVDRTKHWVDVTRAANAVEAGRLERKATYLREWRKRHPDRRH